MPTDEVLLASAIGYLIEGNEIFEASLLLLCEIKTHPWNSFGDGGSILIEIIGNRSVYDIIQNKDLLSRDIIERAFDAVLPINIGVESINTRAELVSIDETSWRKEMENVLLGKGAVNQGKPIDDKPRFTWENLRFRAPVEIAIAKVLNEYDVFFLPNCMARFGSSNPKERKNREADFVVCCDGKWGILEIDGDKYHPSAARDHERDRLFSSYGIKVIHRYTAEQCVDNPKHVVEQFLSLLKKNG